MDRFGDIPPNQSLFVKNLNQSIKLPDLKSCLYEAFSRYGDIHEIVASGAAGKRGFAFVVFTEITMATAAMRALNTKPFLDRPLKIAYAKGKSDVVARIQGTWKPRERKDAKDAKGEKPDKAKALPGSSKLEGEGRPGAVLFAENLPPECTEVMLTMLFRQYPGFEEVRLVAERRVAFCQFKEPNYADQAMNGLQGFMVGPGHPLKLSIAKHK
jgi:U2 small nuclear ribonucleoprotein B''